MKSEKQFKKNKSILPLFISLIIILSFTIFASIYVITNNSSNEQNLNENSNPLKLGNLLQNQNVNPSLNLDDLILYHIFDSTSYESRGSGSSGSSSSSPTSEADNLDNPTEDSAADSDNEETDSTDSSDSVDNIQTSDDKKSKLIDDENDGFIDVIVMLKEDEVSDEMLGIAIDSPVEKKLSEIKSKVKTKQDEVLSTLDSSEFRLKHRYKTVSGFSGEITQEGWDELEQDPNVEAIYEDEMLHVTLAQSVPLINADDIHDLGITGEGTVVCVVDTGIDYTHPDLGNCTGDGCKVIDGYDFVNWDEDPMDDYGHGTHVAGIVAANGSIPLDYTDTVGSWYSPWSGPNRGRGNNWYASVDVTLTEIEMYLGIPSSTTLHWFVYENPTATGDFTKIFETDTTSGTGEKFYSSGDISVELEAGKYYLIGVWWGATSIDYGRGYEAVPFGVSFGNLQTGIPGSPNSSIPPDTWNFIYSSGYSHPYYSRIITSTTPLRGIAPDAKLVALKACNSGGWCSRSAMIASVDWCNSKSSTYNIVATTMSIGDSGQYNNETCPIWIDNVINRAHDLGIAVTVSSGNNAYSNGISYPACSPNAIFVGAVYDADVGPQTWLACPDVTTFADKIVCFTNTGPLLDLLAPGSIITSTKLGGGSIGMSGTSMATPFVAGAIALAKEFLPLASPDQIEYVLKKTGIPITDPDNNLSFSRIDFLAAANYSECSSNSDCGTDSYVGDLSCQDDNVWQNYKTYTCDLDILCSNSTAPKLKKDCGEDYCESDGDNYCKDGDVYHEIICHDRGCSSGVCYHDLITEEQEVEECSNGCVEDEGRCLVEVCETVCWYGGCETYCKWE